MNEHSFIISERTIMTLFKGFLKFFSPSITFILCFCIIITSGCHIKKETKDELKDNKAINVRVSKTIELKTKDKIDITGSLLPFDEVIVSNEKSGKIIKIYNDLGDYVNKGQTLAKLDPIDYSIKYNEAKARHQSSIEALEGLLKDNDQIINHSLILKAKAEMDDAFSKQERLKELSKQKLIPQQDYDSAKAKYLAAKAAYENSITSVKRLKEDVKVTKESVNLSAQNLADTNIKAPISGYIQKKDVSLGEYLNTPTEMFVIVQNDPIKIKASIPEKYALKIRKGLKASFTVEAYPDKNFIAEVTRIAPALDQKTRTLEVEFLVNNKENLLKSGLFADMVLDLGTSHKGIFAPESSIYTTVGINKVFTVHNGQLKEHTVDLGDFIDNKVEVINNIEAGSQVVISDVDKLSDGLKVNIVNTEE